IAIQHGEGVLADTGALAADTGKFTGRSPKDRYIVEDETTKEAVWWGAINQPVTPEQFDKLYDLVCTYFGQQELFVRDAYAGANPDHKISLRAVTESSYQSIFVNNLFIRPSEVDA